MTNNNKNGESVGVNLQYLVSHLELRTHVALLVHAVLVLNLSQHKF